MSTMTKQTREYTEEGSLEARVLTAMIVCTEVLTQVAPRWTPRGLFSSPYANLIGNWCVEHHLKHGGSPRASIQAYFQEWGESHQKHSTYETTEEFLASLSERYQSNQWDSAEINPGHTVDLAFRHFNQVAAAQLFEDGARDLDAGNLDGALGRIETFQRVAIGEQADVELFTDKDEVTSTFDVREDPVISYDNALSEFFRHMLEPEMFIAFVAPEKSGKSFHLADMAVTAFLQGRRVAFFEVGDMSKRQVKERLLVRLAGHPARSSNSDSSWPCTVRVPTWVDPPGKRGRDDYQGPDFLARVTHEERVFVSPLSAKKAWKACRKLAPEGEESRFRLRCYPTASVTAQEVAAIVRGWATRGWVPDLVVVDYADILALPRGRMEVRDGIDTTWKHLHTISQENHCLLVTASQCNRDGYERELIDRRNISEDKRKLAHVDGMIGINVTTPEKELGLCRLNWFGARHVEFSARKVCYVAGCLALASPCILATF